jgi:amicoumacin kinase
LPCRTWPEIHPAAMSPEVHRLFSQIVRDECFSRFGVTSGQLVSQRHAFIFDAETPAGPCILKMVHPSHRPHDQLEAEIDWLLYVVGKGIAAPRVHLSVNSLHLERVPAGDSYFSAVSYEKLIGEPIGDTLWNETLFQRWGNLIGRLHRLSAEYITKKQRYTWYDSDFLNLEAYVPRTDYEIRTAAEQVIRRVKDLPLSDFQYGLIHADVYQENLFWAKGELLLFDFDNCEYGHYISDIAIALYAALWRHFDQPDPAKFAEGFLRALLLGYREEHALSQTEIEALPLFLQLREVLIYTVAKKMLDLNNLTPIQARLLKERGNRIAKNQPIVDLTALLKSL